MKPATAKKPAATDKPATPVKKGPVKKGPVKKEPVKKVADQWYVQTDDGEQYGPVSRDELHEWIVEGRLDVSCQVLCEGWQQWKWAEEVFDELGKTGEQTAEESPFAGIGDVTPSDESADPFESQQTSSSLASSSPAATDTGTSDDVRVTALMRQTLAQTRPWVLFLSIFGLIASGLGLLMMFVMIVVSLMAGMIPNILSGLFGIAICGFYIYAAYQLLRYAQQLNVFLRRGGA
ncbi:MAG: GYF domain-containing protein, partial [Thermoguttaceae bacterium]